MKHQEIEKIYGTQFPHLNYQQLLDTLDYDPDNGTFVWKHGKSLHTGEIAGYFRPASPYRYIKIDGRPYKAVDLAYMYMTGYRASKEVLTKDLDPDNLAWDNLYENSEEGTTWIELLKK